MFGTFCVQIWKNNTSSKVPRDFFVTAVSTQTGSRENGLAWWVDLPTFFHNCQNLGVKCEEKCCLSYLSLVEILEFFLKSLIHSPGWIQKQNSNRQEATVGPYLWYGIMMQLYFESFKFWSEIVDRPAVWSLLTSFKYFIAENWYNTKEKI